MEVKEFRLKEGAGELPKIWCFVNGIYSGMYSVCAMNEAGTVLCSHASTSAGYAKYDIGINSQRKHDAYKEKYPDGYQLIWLDNNELEANEEFMSIINKANAAADLAEAETD